MPRRGTSKQEPREVERTILDATEALLGERRLDELSVADILAAAGVSRASFYFYFESKYAVLAALVRRAVAEGTEAAQPWLGHAEERPPRAEVRHGIAEGARIWKDHAGVLRAIVENWRSDPALAELWRGLMASYTGATVARIERDRASGLAPASAIDAGDLAAALTWLGERLYYLAAIGEPPFDDERRLVDVLTGIWLAAVYEVPSAPAPGAGSA